MNTDLIIYNIGQLVTCKEIPIESCSPMENIEIIKNGYLATFNGEIVAIGEGDVPSNLVSFSTLLIDAEGKVVTPGFIDSYIHLIPPNSEEFGNLDHTLCVTKRLNRMLSLGVTTIESQDNSYDDITLKMEELKFTNLLNHKQDIDIFPACSLSSKNNDQLGLFIESLKNEKLANSINFHLHGDDKSIDDLNIILSYLNQHEIPYKLHSHIENDIDIDLALSAKIKSITKLSNIDTAHIDKLKDKDILLNICPLDSFYYEKNNIPARKLVDNNVQLSLSSGFNQKSCPIENIHLAMQIASLKLNLSPKEIFKAITINAAKNIKLDHSVGSLEIGKKADIIVFDTFNIESILRDFGVNYVQKVFKNGSLIYKAR